MAPREVHEIVERLRPSRDEELLDLIRETVAQLNKLGDRLESYVRIDPGPPATIEVPCTDESTPGT
jgi:hypothetical protein